MFLERPFESKKNHENHTKEKRRRYVVKLLGCVKEPNGLILTNKTKHL